MHSIAAAVVKAGILPEETLAEFRRWGHPVEEQAPQPPRRPEEVVQAIEEALQAEGLVVTRETDLDAVNYYLRGQHPALLHVVVREADEEAQEADIDCTYACIPSGEFIIRWHGDTIEDVLTNGETYLEVEGRKVFFNRVRELFFGDTKAFIICTPVKTNG